MPHVVVVGAGIYGSGVALALRDAAAEVTLVDARTPGHPWAASSGLTRVLGLEYGRDQLYLRLAALARERWRDLERRLGVSLYHETGVLLVAQTGQGWEGESAAGLADAGYHPERLDGAAVARRWPSLGTDGIGFACYNPVGGFLASRRATCALADAARVAGARLVAGQAVVAVEIQAGRAVAVRLAGGDRLAADAVVLSPGAWAAALLASVGLPATRSTRQVVTYVKTPPAGYGPDALPVVEELSGGGFYGVPAWAPSGFKVARHIAGPPMDPADPAQRTVRPEDLEAYRAWLRRRIPGLAEAPFVEPHVCCYTMSPDGDFLLGRAPAAPNVVVATGFSGHGFRFAAALAPEIAALALGREPALDLERFRLDRRRAAVAT